ncbi:composite domain of metallo-dependent hydrolase [Auricularia subglabra TFB-10046 SS5]|uniref:Composite domain of metallo-dependent hydrolase n=1 Tax=Auricularia subglabra (strain TFB-10046 / SS5) TaxID=717982 RepID=J0LIB5_AURST|nr:composite domain of metallo-dependent hydrolase [Auricularia subglabra TFB-10046 SS5]
MDAKLPPYTTARAAPRPQFARLAALVALALIGSASFLFNVGSSAAGGTAHTVPINAQAILATCAALHAPVEVPRNFAARDRSDRFEEGTKATLIKNATIWTGNDDGKEIIRGDILLDGGVIRHVGKFSRSLLPESAVFNVVDAKGGWVTPGQVIGLKLAIVDLHSHIGVGSSPHLNGASDTNSRHGITQPWLRALDGLNTHDASFELSISGGVTSSLILPGSANAIGKWRGQGFPIKLRATKERSPFSKLIEPAFTFNGSGIEPVYPPRWRYLKQACGENPSRVYSGTRMDNIYSMRAAYNEARKVKEKQDEYCLNAQAGQWNDLGEFPESLQWEALVEVLRGRVKVNNHCYEAVDLDGIVRLANEFHFHIEAFHHAHETYLVPDLLKKMYGGPPASALFATHARYKREAYRGSEFAPKILHDNGLRVVMKSDHPVLDSRFLLFEAQQAHFYGLPWNVALASVTTTPADLLGLSHRIGSIRKGHDADIVLWDTHPLVLPATPRQVFIDGIPQLKHDKLPESKPAELQNLPKTPDFEEEAKAAVEYEGLPPLTPKKSVKGAVLFTNVATVWNHEGAEFTAQSLSRPSNVVVRAGKVECVGACAQFAGQAEETVDLAGGALAPSLITYGSTVGLQEIPAESTMSDGSAPDALRGPIPDIVGGDGTLIRAVDGLQFAGRDALIAYLSGVSTAVTAPVHSGLIGGLSVAFSLGAPYKLAKGAVQKRVVALHASINKGSAVSISTQISALRRLLLGNGPGDAGKYFKLASGGGIPLVVDVHGADEIATLLELKAEVEKALDGKIKLVLAGATEAHLVAPEIAAADVGVFITRTRPFPSQWSQRRLLPGQPLSDRNAVEVLLAHNVTVAVGEGDKALTRNARFDLGWIYHESAGRLSKKDVIALATSNAASLLGLEDALSTGDMVVYRGGDIFELSAKAVGTVSGNRGLVDIF